MNQIPRRDRYGEEIARARAVFGRHALPDFVTGFDVRLGEFDGDPAMWIELPTTSDPEWGSAQLMERAEQSGEFKHRLHDDLLGAFDERYPTFRVTPLTRPDLPRTDLPRP